MAFDASSDFPVDISKQSRLVIPSLEDFVGRGLLEMMTSAETAMKIEHHLLGLQRVQTSE
jgi:hypothetical protein